MVSLNDAEEYFRAKQNGENVKHPKNFKPENAFWIGLMQDITSTPAWDFVSPKAEGDQFVSGNNAVLILNQLSEVISEQVDNGMLNHLSLGDAGEKLRDLRQQFMQAKAQGDDKKAAAIREEGKRLGKQLEKDLAEMREQLKPSINQAVDKAVQEAEDIEDAMNMLAGDQDGTGIRTDIQAKKDLAEKLRCNKRLIELARRLGAMRRAWNLRKRERAMKDNYSDIVGAKFSDAVVQAFPSELALAATEEGQALFALRYSQKTILCKDYEAKTKEVGSGPVLIYVDVSGSMDGDRETWSKAITCVVAEEALKQKRPVEIVLFENRIHDSIVIKPDSSDKEELLDFVMSWTTHGGTSFCNVIDHVVYTAKIDSKADILMITDGHAELHDNFVRKLNTFKDQKHIDWHSFCIGETSSTLELFSDHIHTVNTDSDAHSADLFQQVLL